MDHYLKLHPCITQSSAEEDFYLKLDPCITQPVTVASLKSFETISNEDILTISERKELISKECKIAAVREAHELQKRKTRLEQAVNEARSV